MGNALARKLDSLRLRGAMNDAEVADVLGTQPETVSSWVPGELIREGRIDEVLRLAGQLREFVYL